MRVPLKLFLISSLLQVSFLFASTDSVCDTASINEMISVSKITQDKVYFYLDNIHFEQDNIYLDIYGDLLLKVDQLNIDKDGYFIPLFVGHGEPPMPVYCPKHKCYHPPPMCM